MKVKITGDAFVITSSLSVEDIALVAKNAPDKLKVREKASKEGEVGNEVFALSYNEGRPSICNFGITFGGKTRDGKGLATFTGTIPAGTKDAKAFVADKIGPIAAYLQNREAVIPEIIAELKEEREELLSCISEDGISEEDVSENDGSADNGASDNSASN